ncbi:MAG TPA: serine/threonine-protein kinase [Xanthomonadaceae bacterium]|nr:serine/threonine-protein kinase [Xanthomonadaceae bacterium]
MTGRWNSRSAQLEALLDEAFELDAEACARFIETVAPELREDLVKLLKADASSSPVDRDCSGLVEAAAALSGQGGAYSTIAAGQQIGSYRLLRLLGEGGTSSVWLAERVDGSFDHQVAVKCLKTGLATPESRARFLREQQIMAQLLHPCIARLYDAGISSDNVPFIVMEWVDGVSLTSYCDEHRLGLTQRLRLFRKVCSAVAHAHQNLIVHRDLKPANIMVGGDGEPRLLDFGIAKLLDESTPFTRTGMQMLTPEYAAPEQFGDGTITTATDVYALGAVLYELLCGLRPRTSSRHSMPDELAITTPSDALRRASRATTDPHHAEQLAARRDIAPERLRKALRGDLDTIVLKALQVEPERRYATVEAFSDDIERYLRQQPISARKDAGMYRAGKFLRRHAVAVALSAFAIAALLTATTVSIYQARRAQTEARHALATKKFLTDLFEVSDAGMPRDQVPTTQRLLQDGAKRIRGEFSDAPEVKFDLLVLLGRIQLHLGQYASAEPLLKEALAIANAIFTPDSIPWLQAQTQWADVLFRQSHPVQSEQQLRVAIATHRRAGGADSDALMEALSILGHTDSFLGQFDQAIANSREAFDMARRLHGERHPEVHRAQRNLARTLLAAGRLDEAEAVSRANVLLSSELFGDHHAKFADSLNVLAEVLFLQKKDAESERNARQALAIEESVYERPNAALAYTLSSLSGSLYNQDKLDETESILQRLLTTQTQLTAPGDPSTASILFDLGLLAKRRHQYPQAEGELRQVVAIFAKRPHSVAPAREADTWRALAEVLIAQQRLSEANAAVQEAVAIDQGAPGKGGKLVASDSIEFARVDMAMGHLQPALEQANEAIQVLGKSSSTDNEDADEAPLLKAKILNRLARNEDAKNLLLPLVARLRHAGSEYADHDRLSRSLDELGRAQVGTGDTRAALASWDEALVLQSAMHPPDPQEIGELQGLIAPMRNSSGKALH